MTLLLGVVFPGQGMAGGEIRGEIRDTVHRVTGDGEIPYQVSVFASSVDAFESLKEETEPDVVAGHSLGEYAAAYAAGCLELEDGVRLVAERDRLMTRAARENPGGMVVIIGSGTQEIVEVVDTVGATVVAANFNTPRQTVISGEKEALEAVAGRVNGKRRKLDVTGAFHSPLMQDAAVGMSQLLADVPLRDPVLPMLSGIDGGMLTKADEVRLALREQMLSPVHWIAVVEQFAALGVEEVIEAGGGTLVRMLRDFEGLKMQGRTVKEVLA